MSVRHNWLVCKLHTAPTVDKKALLSNKEEFQFNLMSKTWKSTGSRALPICTSRSLTIPPEFFWEQSTKVNNSCEGSTCRPIWSAITLGRMLTDALVSHKACGNSIPFTVITLLLQCNPHPHLFSSFTEHSPDVFFFLSCFSEEHPQSVDILSLLEWLINRNPEDPLPETFLFLIIGPLFRCFATLSFLLLRVLPVETLSSSIGSSTSSEGVLMGSDGYYEGLGLGLSTLSRATSIFGICTQ
ncbi:hypothetical protein F2Q69_00042874 [Brassica cretica]|uniref:Uncharacterized protein n=1 Tax=Brassica cretica TaxID=69181 RepID=A0A8S9NR19_BRACR|nr:hypothetical protein F2Q69_00042874 [Brassica cretica]